MDKTASIFAAGHITTAVEIAAQKDVCNRVFQGTVANNAQCKVDYDCTGSSVCSNLLCGPKTEKAKDTGCANAGDVCAAGFYCTDGKPQICKAGKMAGEACAQTSECDPKLRCTAGSTVMPTTMDAGAPAADAGDAGTTVTPPTTGGVCVARGQAGGTCAVDSDCDPSASFCNIYAGNICTTGLSFAAGGGSCKTFIAGM